MLYNRESIKMLAVSIISGTQIVLATHGAGELDQGHPIMKARGSLGLGITVPPGPGLQQGLPGHLAVADTSKTGTRAQHSSGSRRLYELLVQDRKDRIDLLTLGVRVSAIACRHLRWCVSRWVRPRLAIAAAILILVSASSAAAAAAAAAATSALVLLRTG